MASVRSTTVSLWFLPSGQDANLLGKFMAYFCSQIRTVQNKLLGVFHWGVGEVRCAKETTAFLKS